MSIVNKYKVISINKKACSEWLLHKHYAKSIQTIVFAFGPVKKNKIKDICIFVISTTPAINNDKSLFKSLFIQTYELNQLIIDKDLPKNTLS